MTSIVHSTSASRRKLRIELQLLNFMAARCSLLPEEDIRGAGRMLVLSWGTHRIIRHFFSTCNLRKLRAARCGPTFTVNLLTTCSSFVVA